MIAYEGPTSRRLPEWQPAHFIRCRVAPRSSNPGVTDIGGHISSRPLSRRAWFARASSSVELRVPTATSTVPRSSTPAVNRYSQRDGLRSLTFASNPVCAVGGREVIHNVRGLRCCDVRSKGVDHFLYDSLPDL